MAISIGKRSACAAVVAMALAACVGGAEDDGVTENRDVDVDVLEDADEATILLHAHIAQVVATTSSSVAPGATS